MEATMLEDWIDWILIVATAVLLAYCVSFWVL